MLDRRTFLTGAAAAAGLAHPAPAAAKALKNTAGSATLPRIFDEIERRTFAYFRDTTNSRTGLAPDRWPSAPFASIAATGFALTAWPIGEARGWITRAEARARTLAALRFFWQAPQGDGAEGFAGHRGFFYHFLHLDSGHRFARCELSSIDTCWLLCGMLFAAQWFDRDEAEEAEIRDLAERIYARVDWRWMQVRAPLLTMGWHPESGFIAKDWYGYNEAMLLYPLAFAAPRHAIGPEAWDAWCATYRDHWRGEGDTRHLAFAPHFGHQFSHVWGDFRGIRDAAMHAAGFDYFENSRRATYAQRAYAIANPMRWDGYSRDIWGLTASDGPADVAHEWHGAERRFRTYSARGPAMLPDGFDDGTIAPTAAIASLPFAPEIVTPAARALRARRDPRLYDRHGFADAFNPSFRWPGLASSSGTVDRRLGWVASDRLGIDQGPILAMIANARDGLVWNAMRKCKVIRSGLALAGFRGGWLAA